MADFLVDAIGAVFEFLCEIGLDLLDGLVDAELKGKMRLL